MAFDAIKCINENVISLLTVTALIGGALMASVIWLFLSGDNFNGLARPYAPPGQTLYVLSKVIAVFVYLLMWWQMMLGIVNKTNIKYHALFGTGIFILIFSHVLLFLFAISTRQEKFNLSLLLPDFTDGYYKSGLSFGIFAFLCIIIAIMTGMLRKKLQRFWKVGHSFIYITFALATVHSLMIGSDVNSGMFLYIVYSAVFSLIIIFIYQKLIAL